MWGLYDFLSRALSATSSSIRSALFKNHSFAGESTVRRTPHATERILWQENPPALPTPQSHQRQTTESRAGPIAQDRGSISFTGRGRSFKETLRFFDGDRFNGNGGTRFVGSRFAVHAIDLLPYSSFRGELRPFHSCLTNLRSCYAACPTRRRKPESHAARRRGCRPT